MSNPFDIWAPDCRCDMNNTAFSAYACFQQQIEDFIDVLAASGNPNDESEQMDAAMCVGLNISSLSDSDIKYIEREVKLRSR